MVDRSDEKNIQRRKCRRLNNAARPLPVIEENRELTAPTYAHVDSNKIEHERSKAETPIKERWVLGGETEDMKDPATTCIRQPTKEPHCQKTDKFNENLKKKKNGSGDKETEIWILKSELVEVERKCQTKFTVEALNKAMLLAMKQTSGGDDQAGGSSQGQGQANNGGAEAGQGDNVTKGQGGSGSAGGGSGSAGGGSGSAGGGSGSASGGSGGGDDGKKGRNLKDGQDCDDADEEEKEVNDEKESDDNEPENDVEKVGEDNLATLPSRLSNISLASSDASTQTDLPSRSESMVSMDSGRGSFISASTASGNNLQSMDSGLGDQKDDDGGGMSPATTTETPPGMDLRIEPPEVVLMRVDNSPTNQTKPLSLIPEQTESDHLSSGPKHVPSLESLKIQDRVLDNPEKDPVDEEEVQSLKDGLSFKTDISLTAKEGSRIHGIGIVTNGDVEASVDGDPQGDEDMHQNDEEGLSDGAAYGDVSDSQEILEPTVTSEAAGLVGPEEVDADVQPNSGPIDVIQNSMGFLAPQPKTSSMVGDPRPEPTTGLFYTGMTHETPHQRPDNGGARPKAQTHDMINAHSGANTGRQAAPVLDLEVERAYDFRNYPPDERSQRFDTGVGQQPEFSTQGQMLPSGSTRSHPGSQIQSDSSIAVRYGSRPDVKEFTRDVTLQRYPKDSTRGVLLWQSNLCICRNKYRKDKEWIDIQLISRGGQGAVQLCYDFKAKKQFCMKSIYKNFRPEEVDVMLQVLDHPGFVHIYGILYFDGEVHILMEYVQGSSLHDWIKTHDRLTVYEALFIIQQVLESLIHLKQKNILHDDIKAQNVIFIGCGAEVSDGFSTLMVKVCDFGMSCFGTPKHEQEGTASHYSPEKARSEGHGFPADVYAAMIAFIHMLLGRVPRDELCGPQQVYKIGTDGPPLEELPENMSARLRQFIGMGLHANPVVRATAEELLAHEILQMLEKVSPTDDQLMWTMPEPQVSQRVPVYITTVTPDFGLLLGENDDNPDFSTTEYTDDEELEGAVGGMEVNVVDTSEIRRPIPAEHSMLFATPDTRRAQPIPKECSQSYQEELHQRYSDVQMSFLQSSSVYTDGDLLAIAETGGAQNSDNDSQTNSIALPSLPHSQITTFFDSTETRLPYVRRSNSSRSVPRIPTATVATPDDDSNHERQQVLPPSELVVQEAAASEERDISQLIPLVVEMQVSGDETSQNDSPDSNE